MKRRAFALLLVVALVFAGGWPGGAAPVGGTGPVRRAADGATAGATSAIALELVARDLADPVGVVNAGDGSDRLFVVERVGRIRVVDRAGRLLVTPFLDIVGQVKSDFIEQGMLGVAFHPNYETNGLFFVYYTDFWWNGSVFLVRYRVSADDPNRADPTSEERILPIPKAYVNHNGGTIRFGPDGYLYVAVGDGGPPEGDPHGNGQNTATLLGKLLRIDVDRASEGRAYAIPPDNPFARDPNARPEIWASGLRNPWQFGFDRATGDLFVPDVGQDGWEEVNVQAAGSAGGQNYGWNVMEGPRCRTPAAPCLPVGVPPVAAYPHAQDGAFVGCAVTGIGVYRGATVPVLTGTYLNADFCSGTIWSLRRERGAAWTYRVIAKTGLRVAGSGEDEAGELYLTSCVCSGERWLNPLEQRGGTLWRVVAAGGSSTVGLGAGLAAGEGRAATSIPHGGGLDGGGSRVAVPGRARRTGLQRGPRPRAGSAGGWA